MFTTKGPLFCDGAVWGNSGKAEEPRLEGVLHRLPCEVSVGPVLIVCDVYVSQADEPARAPVFGCVPESEKDTYVVSAATLSVELRASEPQSVE